MQLVAPPTGSMDLLGGLPTPASGLSRRRVLSGLGLCLVGLPVLTAIMVALPASVPRESALLVYLLAVVVVSVVGGLLPGVLAAVGGFLLANWFLTPPYRTLDVGDPGALTDLVVFILAAGIVSVTVEVGARNRAKAARNGLLAHMVSRLSSAEMHGVGVDEVLAQVQHLFDMTTVTLVREGQPERPLAQVGPPPRVEPSLSVPAGGELRLLAYGRPTFAEDRLLLQALAGTAGRAWESRQLAQDAARAAQLAETDRIRSALLTAVGHDLRTPIAGIKAAASGLRQEDVVWEPGEEAELLATIEDGADRLAALVDNLLAMSRIQAGAVSVHTRAVAVEEVVSRALLATGGSHVVLDIPDQVPAVLADAGLLERVLANLVDNARRYTPAGQDVEIAAETSVTEGSATSVRICVVDHGPGADPRRWEEMFVPFQRLGDTAAGGLGLGLAIARGLTEAMGGTVCPSQTPGGGLTMCVQLPAVGVP